MARRASYYDFIKGIKSDEIFNSEPEQQPDVWDTGIKIDDPEHYFNRHISSNRSSISSSRSSIDCRQNDPEHYFNRHRQEERKALKRILFVILIIFGYVIFMSIISSNDSEKTKIEKPVKQHEKVEHQDNKYERGNIY